jgi:hypothetical protein
VRHGCVVCIPACQKVGRIKDQLQQEIIATFFVKQSKIFNQLNYKGKTLLYDVD